ncbi:MAG TPA: 5'-nucleotidase, lipoprotein e(P4) family [Thermoanaerobaculia bacterium]
MKRTLLALLACSSFACATTTTAPAAAPAAAAEPAPCNAGHSIVNATLWIQSAAEYRAAALQTYANARRALDAALAERTGELPPAVILDLDETVLDNTQFQGRVIRQGKTYERAAWKQWTSEGIAPAIPGALEFLQYARSRGVRPFYITNRDQDEEAGTLRNLQTLGAPLDPNVDTLLQRGENGWESDKTSRREYVAKSHRVLLVIGDDLNDFANARESTHEQREEIINRTAGEWGTRWFILPNPIYGSWERAAIGAGGTDCEQLQRKIDALR